MKKRTKGFTLVELVVVMVIVGILAAISVPVYKGYTKRAMAAEGKTLVGTVAQAEKVYYAEFGVFKAYAGTASGDASISVDSRANKYFTAWSVTAAADAFTVTSSGAGDATGITVQYVQPSMTTSGSINTTGE